MSKNLISIFFSVFFMLFLVAPTVVSLVDSSVDVSIFYASTEEEKGKETHKDIELVFSDLKTSEDLNAFEKLENNLGYRFKNYPIPHLNLISPPPELHVL